jgi:HK97 family phage major capsid protein
MGYSRLFCCPEVIMEDENEKEEGNALKAISSTDDELRVGNYIVLFGGRDLTAFRFIGNKTPRFTNKDGSAGEFFSKSVDLESDYTSIGRVPINWEHGADPDSQGVDKDEILGYVDWKTATTDEKGIFVERVLNRRKKYTRWVEELILAGMIGTSTEPIQKGIVTKDNGEIIRWPLKKDTLTVTPMEPRMLNDNTIRAMKSLVEAMPELETVIPLKSISVTQATSIAEAEPTAQAQAPIKSSNTNTGVITMELDEIKLQEMLAKASADAIKGFVAAQPSKVEPDIQVTADEADRASTGNPFKTAGEFFNAVKNAGVYPSQTDQRLLTLKATGLNEAIPSQGGFLVPTTMSNTILEGIYPTGSMLNMFNRIPVQGNSMTFNVVDETSRATGSRWGGVTGYWLNEGGTKTASKPSFRQVELKLQKVAALVVATDELLEDSTALAAWLQRTVPLELKFKVEDAIINGDGVGKPLGIMNSGALKTVSVRTDAGEIDAVDLGNMWASRAVEYNDYIWLVNPGIFPQLLNMTIGTTPVFLGAGGVSAQPYNTLLGRPMFETEYNAALGTVGDIILMSPSAYPMIEKAVGVQSASSIHVYFTSDETAFRFVYRVGGAPAWYSTRTEKDARTTSPFVVLSAST